MTRSALRRTDDSATMLHRGDQYDDSNDKTSASRQRRFPLRPESLVRARHTKVSSPGPPYEQPPIPWEA